MAPRPPMRGDRAEALQCRERETVSTPKRSQAERPRPNGSVQPARGKRAEALHCREHDEANAPKRPGPRAPG
eukprot:1827677-Lingulodinium_polyedra.AAC.1